MNRRDIAAGLLLAGATTALVIAGTAQGMTGPVSDPAFVSGTIRWVNSTTWEIVDDAAHEPTGMASVTPYSTYVRVDYDFTAAEVGSCQVTSDEAFASADVRVGTSVGLDNMRIYFYMPSYGSTPVPPSLLSKAGANVWITCHHITEAPIG